MSKFDELTMALGSGLDRRTMFKLIGATGLAAAFTGFKAGEAEAGVKCPCKNVFVCSAAEACGAAGSNCGCVPKVKKPSKGFCHAGQTCTGLIPCTKNGDCKKAGLIGWKCALDTCCGTGAVCLPCCGGAAGATKGGGKTTLG